MLPSGSLLSEKWQKCSGMTASKFMMCHMQASHASPVASALELCKKCQQQVFNTTAASLLDAAVSEHTSQHLPKASLPSDFREHHHLSARLHTAEHNDS